MRATMPEALAAFNSPDHFYAARLARKSLDRAEACIPQAPFMIDLYMIAAVDRRVLGQFDEAVKLYERALDYDRRPELYLQLGLTELELNRRAEARKALEKAVLFAPSMLNEISDPEMHSSLSRIVADAAHTRRNEKRPVREGTGLRDE